MAKLKQLSLHDVAIDDYSFLAGCKSLNTLDLQDTSFSDCRLLAELPALKKVLLPPYSQLKYREVLEQPSCLQEIKEEKTEELKAAEQPCGEGTLSEGSPASEEPLHLGDTAHLSIDGMGIVLFSPEVMRYVVPARLSGFQCGERVSGDDPAGGGGKGQFPAVWRSVLAE